MGLLNCGRWVSSVVLLRIGYIKRGCGAFKLMKILRNFIRLEEIECIHNALNK